jgi:hypothetical protein
MQYRMYLYQRSSSTGDPEPGRLYRTDVAGRRLETDVADGWRVVQVVPSRVASQFCILLEQSG